MTEDLSDIRVLELGGGIAAATAGKLLADLGAHVVKVEPPEGDALRHGGAFDADSDVMDGSDHESTPPFPGSFLFLNTNKRSLTLDWTQSEDRTAWASLAGEADLIIHDLPPARLAERGLDFEALSAAHPALVVCSITPFGLTGPHRDYAANDLTLVHAGGWGWLCPGKATPIERPPIKPFGQHALTQAGLHAAVTALASVIGARETGRGDHIDLSVQEVITYMLGRHFAVVSYADRVDSRTSPAVYEPMSFYPTRDGHVFLICPEQNQFERLVALMGNPAWAQGEKYASRNGREAHAVELKARLSEWTVTLGTEEIFHLCQKERVGAAPAFDYPALEAQQHLHERDFFAQQDHPVAGSVRMPGAPYHLRNPMWRSDGPAPDLGEANAEAGSPFPQQKGRTSVMDENGKPQDGAPLPLPLAGMRVLDLSWVWAGPHCTQLLSLLGAEVIKVETSKRPDLTRRSHLYASGMEPGINRCGYYNQINQGKLSIGINLGEPEGVALIKRLAKISDVMVSNFATGVIERLGLGADAMQEINPRLIVTMISAFGQTGPNRHYTGYGPLISPLAGLSAQTGYEDAEPRDVGLAYGDPNSGVYAAVAILAAWLNDPRSRGHADTARPDTARSTTKGQVIDISMWEAMLCTAFEGWMNHALGYAPFAPMGNHSPRHAPHNLYRCQGEDAWVAVAVETPDQWQGLCAALERPDLVEDPRYATPAGRKADEATLDQVVGAWCAERTTWEVTEQLQAHGVPSFPSMDSRALLADAHLRSREVFTTWPHPEAGPRELMGAPWRMSRRPNGLGKAAPCLGEDTDSVLERLLGLDASTRADLRTRGVIE